MVLVSSPVNQQPRDTVSKSAMGRGSGAAAQQKRQATAHNGRNREGSHVVQTLKERLLPDHDGKAQPAQKRDRVNARNGSALTLDLPSPRDRPGKTTQGNTGSTKLAPLNKTFETVELDGRAGDRLKLLNDREAALAKSYEDYGVDRDEGDDAIFSGRGTAPVVLSEDPQWQIAPLGYEQDEEAQIDMFTGISPSVIQDAHVASGNSTERNLSCRSRGMQQQSLGLAERTELLRRLGVSSRARLQDTYAIIFGFLVETGRQGTSAISEQKARDQAVLNFLKLHPDIMLECVKVEQLEDSPAACRSPASAKDKSASLRADVSTRRAADASTCHRHRTRPREQRYETLQPRTV